MLSQPLHIPRTNLIYGSRTRRQPTINVIDAATKQGRANHRQIEALK